MPKFPKTKKIKARLKSLMKAQGSSLLPPSATPSECFKFELCKKLIIYMHDRKLNQRDLSHILEVNESRISEIVHYKINKLTINRLISYNELLYPNIKFKVA